VRYRPGLLLFVALVLLATLPLVLLSGLQGILYVRDRSQAASEQLAETAEAIAYRTEEYLDLHRQAMAALAAGISLEAPGGDPQALDLWLERHRAAYPGFLTMIATDAEGKIVAASPPAANGRRPIARSGMTVADRPYFQRPRATGLPYVSSAFRGRGFGSDPIVAVSAPLLGSGREFRGVVEGSLNLEAFQRFSSIYRRNEGAEILITDSSGRVLWASEGSGYQPLGDASLLAGLARPAEVVKADVDGETWLLASARSRSKSWLVVVRRPWREVMGALVGSYVLIALGVVGAVGLSAVLARAILAWASRPQQREEEVLKRHAAEMARVNDALKAEIEERARAEGERDRFFDVSLEMLCIAGTDGYFKELNPAWERTLGWTPEELTSRPYVDFVHPDDRSTTAVEDQRLQMGGTVIDFENRYRTKDGGYRWLSWRCLPEPGRGLIYAVARDIQDQKEIEQMKNDFVSVVSHELRTPLTSIRGSLGLLAGGVAGELPEKARSLVEIAAQNGERLGRLINDILDIEKIESGRMGFRFAPTELGPLVEHAIESNRSYAEAYGVELRTDGTLPEARIWADGDRILQVMANLLSNAAKFSPPGGVVEIGVERLGGHLRVAVTDRGKGIPTELQPRLFEKFVQADASSTRQKGGTGLGLSISKAIVERHGGTIGFESERGVATTFFFELPEWGGETSALSRDGARDRSHDRSHDGSRDCSSDCSRIMVCEDDRRVARLLYVEDDADLQRVVAAVLDHDAEVEQALTLTEARERLVRERFDLVILDLALPDGSGLELLPFLGSQAPPMPVLIFSAHEVEPAVASRVSSVLVKSRTTNRELLERIRSVLAG
jgi:PAS domain S-box-containing protein